MRVKSMMCCGRKTVESKAEKAPQEVEMDITAKPMVPGGDSVNHLTTDEEKKALNKNVFQMEMLEKMSSNLRSTRKGLLSGLIRSDDLKANKDAKKLLKE